ncbi:GNAT family N-acetyltransferase [Sulfurovum sp.]|uniref:GNAT family N-acetyltransferase n=1 Tax=Sulfurovum sp. TaxID=1969726 RepID=UPI00356AA632
MKKENRLYLNSLTEDFISEQYLRWMNDPEVLQFTESRWAKYNIDDLKLFVKNINKSPKDYLFGIFITETGQHIGNIKIGNINDQHKFADLGIIIGDKEEWGKGYATESIKLAVDYAFSKLKLYKVTAGVYINNSGSIKALKKVGFEECGRHIKHCVFDSDRVDTLTLEIINKRMEYNG